MLGFFYLLSSVGVYLLDLKGPWALPFALLGAWFASRAPPHAILWSLSALFILMDLPPLAALLLLLGSVGTLFQESKGYLGD